jgi:cbb3-type cytochrome oxidase cytochrome c subunit
VTMTLALFGSRRQGDDGGRVSNGSGQEKRWFAYLFTPGAFVAEAAIPSLVDGEAVRACLCA